MAGRPVTSRSLVNHELRIQEGYASIKYFPEHLRLDRRESERTGF